MKTKKMSEIELNHQRYAARIKFYKKQGFDQEQARINIIKHIKTDCPLIFEVGTGMGYLTKELAKIAPKVITVDINSADQKIAILNAKYDNVFEKIKFEKGNGEELKYPDKGFDTVVSAFTFHHLVNPFIVINEMIRVFEKRLIIADFHQKGMQIIDRIHAIESRKHHSEDTDFSIVGVYLEENNLLVKSYFDDWQTIYVAERR